MQILWLHSPPLYTNCFELLKILQQDFGVLWFVLLKLFYLYKFKYSKVRLCIVIVLNCSKYYYTKPDLGVLGFVLLKLFHLYQPGKKWQIWGLRSHLFALLHHNASHDFDFFLGLRTFNLDGSKPSFFFYFLADKGQ